MKVKSKHWYIKIFIGCCLIELAAVGILCNCAGIFIHYICDDMGFSYGKFSFYFTIKGIICSLSMPFAVYLLKKYDTRLVLGISTYIYIIANASFKWCTQIWQWYFIGAILGIMQAICMTTPIPIILNNWYIKRKGTIIGAAIACAGIGGAIFGPVETYLIETYGWRDASLYISIISLFLLIPAVMTLRLKPEQIGLVPYNDLDSPAEEYIEKNSNAAIEDEKSKKNVDWLLIFLAFLISLCFTFSSHLAGYAQYLSYSVVVASSLTSACMIGNTIGKLILGAMNDCISTKVATMTGSMIVIIGIILMVVFSGNSILLFGGSLLYGMSLSMNAVGTPLIVASLYQGEQYANVISKVLMANSFGGAFGVSLIGWSYDYFNTYKVALVYQLITYIFILGEIVYLLKVQKNNS